MILKDVTLTLNDMFALGLHGYSGLTVYIDGVNQTMNNFSQITFTPSQEAYILKVEYQGFTLYDAIVSGSIV